ncbi:hypothetical protein [Sideroxydans sp. CL21]|nr:hypothetical protein [Sideroxydans sp. CL21]
MLPNDRVLNMNLLSNMEQLNSRPWNSLSPGEKQLLTLNLRRTLENMKFRSTDIDYVASHVWITPEFLAKQNELIRLEFQRLRELPQYRDLSDLSLMERAQEFSRV